MSGPHRTEHGRPDAGHAESVAPGSGTAAPGAEPEAAGPGAAEAEAAGAEAAGSAEQVPWPPAGPLLDGRRVLPPLPPWEAATWEGARYEALRTMAAMTFRERLEWMIVVQELAARGREAARATGRSGHEA